MIGPLLALPSTLDALHDRVLTEPAVVAQELSRLQTTTAAAIEPLRFITAGVLPPLLARHGLVAALQTYACQSARHPVIHAQDGIERTRLEHQQKRRPMCLALDRSRACSPVRGSPSGPPAGGCAFP